MSNSLKVKIKSNLNLFSSFGTFRGQNNKRASLK